MSEDFSVPWGKIVIGSFLALIVIYALGFWSVSGLAVK